MQNEFNNAIAFTIDDLRVNPAWVPEVSFWHHQEWLVGADAKDLADEHSNSGLSSGQDREHSTISADWVRRQESLNLHLGDDPFPVSFIAHQEGVAMGSVSLVNYRFTREAAPSQWLTNLYVLPSFRCCGVAQALLDQALGYAERCGVAELKLYTNNQGAYYAKRNWRKLHRSRLKSQWVDIFEYDFGGVTL